MKTQQIDFGKYPGEWVLTCNNEVIAHHKDVRKLRDAIKKCKTTPVLTPVPTDEIMIF